MYKVKRFSKMNTLKTLGKNAKRQVKETPLTAASLSIMALNAANGLYNTESSRRTRKKTINELSKLGGKKSKNNIIIT